ncbi:MAG: hypothetical protein V4697_00665 [Patescibacteria group bacterium]
MEETKIKKSQLYAGIIWIVSAIALAIYAVLLFSNSQIPGMGELVKFLSEIEDTYIYLAAFISVFIEGLYFIGSFFPGASLVIIIAIISGASGYGVFLTTILLIFIGWSLAGMVNIYFAKVYRNKIIKTLHSDEYHVKDRVLATWFPAFRSSYEVAQVVEGGNPMKVYISSLRVRFWATLFVGALALIVPLLFDIQTSSDRESFVTIFIVFAISLVVGIKKVRDYYSVKDEKMLK